MSDNVVGALICVVLPVTIVLISAIRKILISRQRTTVLLKAIETNNDVDIDRLSDMMKSQKRTPKQLLQLRLLRGSIFSLVGLVICTSGLCKIIRYDSEAFQLIFGACLMAVGVSYLIVYFMSRKDIEGDNKGYIKHIPEGETTEIAEVTEIED